MEKSNDIRKYQSHRDIHDSEGNPILKEDHNYITIRGYYNGPDEWVPKHEDSLYTPVDLSRALRQGIIDKEQQMSHLQGIINRLEEAGYDGTLLRPNDLLLAVDKDVSIMTGPFGEPEVIICDFELIWKIE
jgi:hypothetical protein